jgi:signal transduction histidine kinase
MNPTYIVRGAAGPLATALAYLLTARVGEWLAFPSAPVSALWAPNAILLAALLLARRDRWWVYLAVILPFHFYAQWEEAGVARATLQYVANAAEALLGAWALLAFCPPPLRFDRVRPVVLLIGVAGFASPLVTSVAMAGAFALVGIAGDFPLTVAVRTLTNTFAIAMLVPLIVHGAQAIQGGRREVPVVRLAECVVLAVALAAVSAYVFAGPAERGPLSVAWLFAPMPFLVWATIRLHVPGACSAVLLVGVISALGALRGAGPFDGADPVENALSLVAFQLVLAVTFVLGAALLEEWRFATRARIRAESLHAAVLGSVHDQIAVLDKDGRVIEVNDSWRRGVETADTTRFDRVTAPDSYLEACQRAAEAGDAVAAEHFVALRSVLEGRETRRHFEHSEPAGADSASIEVSIESLKRPEGGAVVTRADVTARRRAERESLAREQQLTHLGRAAVLGQLSGAFAHELNQPLTAILGNAEAGLKLLEGGADPRELREILADIVQDDLRAAQVLDRLRALLERGDRLRRPVDLNATVQEVLAIARSELLARHVRVTTDLEPGAPAVMADRVQLQQVVLNLLINACEAMRATPPDERKVELATRFVQEESSVQVTMRDQGCGIASGDLERIFQPFVTTKPSGMGMGLAICRSVAEAHRGRLWAESGPAGTVFHLRIPVGGVLA